jgi:hypothetical protein
MAQPDSVSKLGIRGLIVIPAVITLAITLLRLAGELAHGPSALFNRAPGGPWAIVGIIWLVPVIGVYFALKLTSRGERPRSLLRAIGFPFLAVVIIYILSFAGSRINVQQHFRERLIYGYTTFALAAFVTWPGWPSLFRVLVAYAYSARLPVAVVTFFALWRQWGTHYDAAPLDMPGGASLFIRYLGLGIFTQLVFWVAVTVVVGMFFGGLAAGVAQLKRHAPRAVSREDPKAVE